MISKLNHYRANDAHAAVDSSPMGGINEDKILLRG